jgi:cell division septation protein DedD
MSKAQEDTEITLGTGRMLALFFTLVLVCAVFFAIGFSLGRKTSTIGIGGSMTASAGAPVAVVRPSPAATKPTTPAQPPSGDFSFYNSVGAKTANTDLAAKPAEPQPVVSTANTTATTVPAVATDVPPATGGYLVQVAAVSRQEDADSLVEALKKKQYPAFSTNNAASDKFFHVQVGPYSDLKEAEAMKARLIADGYSPIVKK